MPTSQARRTARGRGPSFTVKAGERECIRKIAARAVRMAKDMGASLDPLEVAMDVTACHANGTPLHLGWLLDAGDLDFAHDVFGIREHLDRDSGELRRCFSPRAHSVLRADERGKA